MFKKTGILAFLLLTPATFAAAQPIQSTPTVAELEALLERHDVPGLSYAQIDRCDVTANRAVGLADIGANAPVTEHTLFEAASLSKPVFTWLVMDLARSGVIDLDRPFADYGFDWPRIVDTEAYAKLTPRLVLTHRTGLPNWVGQAIDKRRGDPIEFKAPPGTEHSYSGEGFQLLQAFVEQQTGKSLGTLFRERLGHIMPRSSFNANFQPDTRTSRGYTKASTPEEGSRDMMPVGDVELAAASLATTANDYAAFVSLVCHRAMLPAASYDEMLRPQTPERIGADGVPIRWALGWSIAMLGSREFVIHTGNNGQYRAVAGFFPDNGQGFVIFTNGMQGEAMISEFLGLDDPERRRDQQEAD